MKNYIKSIAVFLLTAFALTSCNDNFDEGDDVRSYPAKIALETWAREYTPAGAFDYTVNFTVNEAGDTICDITRYNAANGNANVFSAGEVEYDPQSGMTEVFFATSPYNEPAVAYVTYQRDLARATCTIYTVSNGRLSKKDNFAVHRAEAPSVFGDWVFGSLELRLNPDGTATVTENGTTADASYVFSGKTGTVTLADGTQIQLALNEKGQMIATRGGESFLATHIPTVVREDWAPYCKGIYTCAMNDAPAELIMEYSENEKMLRIKDFCDPGTVLTAYWEKGEADVTPAESMFYAFTHPSYGDVFAVPVAITAGGATALFQDGVFYFGFSWDVPGVGSFGSAMDTFQPTEML